MGSPVLSREVPGNEAGHPVVLDRALVEEHAGHAGAWHPTELLAGTDSIGLPVAVACLNFFLEQTGESVDEPCTPLCGC